MKARDRPLVLSPRRRASRVVEGWGDASRLLWLAVVVGWFAVALVAVMLMAWALGGASDIVVVLTGE